jgi:hypothetical protein
MFRPFIDTWVPRFMSAALNKGQFHHAFAAVPDHAARVRLSVVIPVYNGEATIGSLLDALLPQCDARCEIIVVDDGSTDGTPALLKGYAERGVKCLRPACNSGAAAARNMGAAAAAGDTVLFFDSDDVPSPVLLPTVLATLEAYPEAAFGAYLLAEQPLSAVERSVLKQSMAGPPKAPRVYPQHAYVDHLLVGKRLVTASSGFVRKSLLDAHGGFPAGMRGFEDGELWARLSACTPLVQIPELLAIYRVPEVPPARRTKAGAANRFILTLRKLAAQYGPRYRLAADVFAIRMAIVARASGATVRACADSLQGAGAGPLVRLLGAALVIGLGPSALKRGLRLYRRVRRRRTARITQHS